MLARPPGPSRSLLSLVVAVWAAVGAFSPQASAAPRLSGQLDARVVWQRADLIYVVLEDTNAVARGDTLLLRAGKKQVAAACIVSIAEGGLAVARVASGTLAKERKLDRLRVLAARVSLPSPAILRVGFPSPQRTALRWGCGPWTLRPPSGVGYQVNPTGRLPGYRLTRDSTGLTPQDPLPASSANTEVATWPETIVATLFDDAAEEEIALERGDLDVALFGPGELSARMRGAPRWQDRLFASPAPLAAPDSTALSACSASGGDCPILVVAELIPYVRALGPSAFLRMIQCGAETGRP